MSRDAVRFGRVPKREKAKILAAMQSSKAKIMENRVLTEMADDRKMIDTIVRAHYDTCDYTAEKITPFISRAQAAAKLTQCTGQTCPMKGGPEQSFLDEFSDRFMDHVRQVCTFAKSIPGFKCLQHDDQVTLLKSCVFEVLTVRLSGLFDNQSLVCLNGDVIRRETISAMPAGNAKFLMDNVFELAQRINRFRLSDAEIGLFCSVVIITADRPGLRNAELVGRMQTKLKNVLQNILVPQHPHHTTIFSDLLTIIHDLRTLNTLHTEKFLQQAKVTRDEVTSSPSSSSSTTSSSSIHSQLSYDRDRGAGSGVNGGNGVTSGEWDDANLMDGDSTGSRSPQSSSDSPSATSNSFASNSLEDLRRSPGMGSVSSSESLGSSENFSKLSVNDLKIHGVGSVLLNALTSPAMSPHHHNHLQPQHHHQQQQQQQSSGLMTGNSSVGLAGANRKRELSRLSCSSDTGLIVSRSQAEGSTAASPPISTGVAPVSGGGSDQKCPFKTRKLDSPSDSGIDSPKAQGSQSTNTSVCSSPRSSMEEPLLEEQQQQQQQQQRHEQDTSLEEQHPLLKRALQQPPQPFNMAGGGGGVSLFQDEVYKPHKKFRHSGRRDGDEPTSTSSSSQDSSASGSSSVGGGPSSPTAPTTSSSTPSLVHSHSILASQLAAPPTFSQQGYKQQSVQRASPSPTLAPAHQSLLATTLSRPVSVPRAKHDEERSELLANLILDSGRYRPSPITLKALSQQSTTTSSSPPVPPPSSLSTSLLMCATATTPLPAHTNIPDRPWTPPSHHSAVTVTTTSGGTLPPRHLPVAVAPTSHQLHHQSSVASSGLGLLARTAVDTRIGGIANASSSAASNNNNTSLTAATAQTEEPLHPQTPQPTCQLRSALLSTATTDVMPLNLSVRTPPVSNTNTSLSSSAVSAATASPDTALASEGTAEREKA